MTRAGKELLPDPGRRTDTARHFLSRFINRNTNYLLAGIRCPTFDTIMLSIDC
ncbi:MAG: hypothetical protein M0P69_04350 [Bacteroidales bacterium]|nr:hypothetical protein [Bacteroidales bacterium]